MSFLVVFIPSQLSFFQPFFFNLLLPCFFTLLPACCSPLQSLRSYPSFNFGTSNETASSWHLALVHAEDVIPAKGLSDQSCSLRQETNHLFPLMQTELPQPKTQDSDGGGLQDGLLTFLLKSSCLEILSRLLAVATPSPRFSCGTELSPLACHQAYFLGF